MNCPNCGSLQVKVVDSRRKEASISRRRECLDCGKRFSTIEVPIKK